MSTTPIVLTERAIKEVKQVMQEQGFAPESFVLEAGLIGGGCSGWTWKLGFKEKEKVNPEKEVTMNIDGIDVVVSHRALLYMEGTTIDFHEGLNQRGFSFKNNAVRSTCGCGKSVQF